MAEYIELKSVFKILDSVMSDEGTVKCAYLSQKGDRNDRKDRIQTKD